MMCTVNRSWHWNVERQILKCTCNRELACTRAYPTNTREYKIQVIVTGSCKEHFDPVNCNWPRYLSRVLMFKFAEMSLMLLSKSLLCYGGISSVGVPENDTIVNNTYCSFWSLKNFICKCRILFCSLPHIDTCVICCSALKFRRMYCELSSASFCLKTCFSKQLITKQMHHCRQQIVCLLKSV